MATRQHGYRLEKATVRGKLKARREPYWQGLGQSRAIGFRKSKIGCGSWTGRWTEPSKDEGTSRPKYQQDVLASGDEPYVKVLELAEVFFKECERAWKRSQLQPGEKPDEPAPETVEDICRWHVKNIRVAKGDLPADDMDQRFDYYVYEQKIAKIHKDDLTARDVLTWRNGLVTPQRKRNTVNRIYRDFAAAMNAAHKLRYIDSDEAWTTVGQFPVGDGTRKEYLTLEQRRLLLAECDRDKDISECIDKQDRKEMPWCTRDTGNLLRGSFITGARPIELVTAKVSALNVREKKITLMSAKNKKGESRPRDFYLYEPGALEFFERMAADKDPNDYLFTKADGSSWVDEKGKPRYQQWGRGVRYARRTVNRSLKKQDHIPEKFVAYTARHVAITDMLSENQIDSKAVETVAGTSDAMIRRNYYHVVQERLKEKLAKRTSF